MSAQPALAASLFAKAVELGNHPKVRWTALPPQAALSLFRPLKPARASWCVPGQCVSCACMPWRSQAHYNLGVMLSRGTGVPRNQARALHHYARAADQV